MHLPSPTERTLSDLDSRIRVHYQKAEKAFKGNQLDYVLLVCKEWVKQYPDVIEFRMLLREAQIKTCYPDSCFERKFRHRFYEIKQSFHLSKRNDLETINQAERILAIDPINKVANQSLAETAKRLGWIKTSIHAWQILLINPNRKMIHIVHMAKLLIENKQEADAITVCETFLKLYPNEPSILDIRNRASTKQSLQQITSN